MSTISDRLDDVETRVRDIEINSAKLDARLNALVSSTNNLKWGIFAITFVCVLALIYGAIGKDGLFAVRNAAASVSVHSNGGPK